MTAVDVMVSLAAIQFSLIVMYHIFAYVFNGAIENKLGLGMNKYIMYVRNKMYTKSQNQQFELQNNTAHLNIPNVTYNYQEYQEPVIGSDYCN